MVLYPELISSFARELHDKIHNRVVNAMKLTQKRKLSTKILS